MKDSKRHSHHIHFNHRSILFFAISLVGVLGGLAATVKGIVTDGSDEPLTGAVIALVGNQRNAVLADSDGRFAIEVPDSGRSEIQITFLGMDTIVRSVDVNYPDSAIDLGVIKMHEVGTTLQEAIVTAVKTAITAKQDTLEYNAGSFRTTQNSTVEDLLKKLPGIEVGSDGSITSGGKTVTKILVDGKEFFGDDPKMASKNLPSDMVDKVQVVDRKSDLARLTGVDDGEEETVINLTVKKDQSNGWFGNVSAAYGTNDRYNGSFVINRFHNGNQFTLLGGLNNVNDMGFTDNGAGRFTGFGGGGGVLSSKRLGFNFNVGNGEKFRVGGNITYSYSDRDTRTRKSTQYLFPDSTSWHSSGSMTRDKGHNLRADLRMQWKIDEYNTLDFRPSFSFNTRKSESSDTSFLRAGDQLRSLVNSSDNSKTNSGNSWQTSGNLIFNHAFASRPGRSFSAQVNYSFSNVRQRSATLSEIIYYLQHNDDEDLYRFIDSRQWTNSVGGRLTWTEPLGDVTRGNFLTIAYRINYRTNNADKYTYDLDPTLADTLPKFPTQAPEGYEPDPGLSNRFRNNYLSQEVQIGYKKVAQDYNLEAGIVFAPSQSASHDLINNNRDIPTRHVWNVSPFARFRYRFSKTRSISANYRARTSEAPMNSLQPVADVSDPLHITIGNPSLKPSFSQSIGANFNDFNSEHQQSIFAAINASYTLNSVANRTVTDPETGVRTTTYSNVNGNFNIFGMGMISRPIGPRHWRINAHLGTRFSNNAGYINGDFNRSGNLQLNPRVGITYSNSIFQMTVNPSYSFSLATNTLSHQPDRTTHTYGFTADATLDLPFGLSISTDLDFNTSTGYLAGFNATQWLWNASISYSMLSDRSLTLSLEANDILRQRTNISRTVSANLISDTETNNLTRYFMVSLTWKFNSLSKKNGSTVNPEEMPFEQGRYGNPGQRPSGSAPGRNMTGRRGM